MVTKKLVVANWKQNKTLEEAVAWCKEFVRLCSAVQDRSTNVSVLPIICPSMAFVERLAEVLGPAQVALGVQDISPFADGAHTGFVGVGQIKQFVKYAIVGHSEREEDRNIVEGKAELCTNSGITPIVCFKSSSQYKQIADAVYALEDPDNISQNGMYRAKSGAEVKELIEGAGRFFGKEAIMLYGGSVNKENAEELARIDGLHGVLVGNASLNPYTFADIVYKFSL